jgi:hypothetical protein
VFERISKLYRIPASGSGSGWLLHDLCKPPDQKITGVMLEQVGKSERISDCPVEDQ